MSNPPLLLFLDGRRGNKSEQNDDDIQYNLIRIALHYSAHIKIHFVLLSLSGSKKCAFSFSFSRLFTFSKCLHRFSLKNNTEALGDKVPESKYQHARRMEKESD